MNKFDEHAKETVLIGMGAILTAYLTASGEWSVFDFGIAVSMLFMGYYFLNAYNITLSKISEILIGALTFGIVTTAAFIALFATTPLFPSFLAAVNPSFLAAVNGGILQWYIYGMSVLIWLIIFSFRSYIMKKRYKAQ